MNEPVARGNLLTRLVGQAAGQRPQLAPRLPALFEPAGSSYVVPTLYGSLDEGVRRHDAHRPSWDGDDVAAETRAASSVTTRAPGDRQATSTKVRPAAVPAGTDVAARARLIPDGSGWRSSRPSIPTFSTVASPSLHARAAAPPTADSDLVASVVAETAPVHQDGPVVGMPDRSLAWPRRDARIAADAAVPPLAGLMPRFAAAPDPHRRGRSASGVSADPVVRISIGRIEVRAAAPSAAPPRRARPQPASLDDYLKQRGRTR